MVAFKCLKHGVEKIHRRAQVSTARVSSPHSRALSPIIEGWIELR